MKDEESVKERRNSTSRSVDGTYREKGIRILSYDGLRGVRTFHERRETGSPEGHQGCM